LIKKLGSKPPVHTIVIRDFVLFCLGRALRLTTCDDVYSQIKQYRLIYKKELLAQGHSFKSIERVMQVAKQKIEDLMQKIKVDNTLSDTEYSNVKSFFANYVNDSRMIELMKKKNSNSAMPEDSDMKILAKALNFQNLWFVTTDGHFKVLWVEIEQQFGIEVVTDDTGHRKMDELKKQLK